jgi:hypothetical protein
MLRAVTLGMVLLVLAAVGASVAWFHARVPPDCRDPRTLALVQRSLTTRFRLPAGATLTDIRTVAGSFLALRFVCQAEVAGVDPQALPPGTPLPGTVHYISRLTPDRRRHEVTVDLQPLLIWEKAQ